MTRMTVSSGSPLEPRIGFSRATRVGPHVAGTAPIPQDGSATPDGVCAQTRLCLDIALKAAAQAGARPIDTTCTWIFLTDISTWGDAARAHGETFADIRPACAFVEVSRVVDPTWRVEVEPDAIIQEEHV